MVASMNLARRILLYVQVVNMDNTHILHPLRLEILDGLKCCLNGLVAATSIASIEISSRPYPISLPLPVPGFPPRAKLEDYRVLPRRVVGEADAGDGHLFDFRSSAT